MSEANKFFSGVSLPVTNVARFMDVGFGFMQHLKITGMGLEVKMVLPGFGEKEKRGIKLKLI